MCFDGGMYVGVYAWVAVRGIKFQKMGEIEREKRLQAWEGFCQGHTMCV